MWNPNAPLCLEFVVQNLSSLTPQCMNNRLSNFEVPESEELRGDMLLELLSLKKEKLSLPGFYSDEIQTIPDFVCTSFKYKL